MKSQMKETMTKPEKVTTYATLINSKITIPSSTTPYFAIEQHFFFDRMQEYLSSVYIDSNWYLRNYPDVGEAIQAGKVSGAAEHYRRYGYYEHRKPHEIIVDETWYADSYPDIKSAIASGVFASGQEHFDTVGFKEGRLPFANFTLRTA